MQKQAVSRWSDFCAKFRRLYPEAKRISSTYISIRYRYLDSAQRDRFLRLRNKNDLRKFVDSLSEEARQYWTLDYVPVNTDCKTFEDTLDNIIKDWSPELHAGDLPNDAKKRAGVMLGIFLQHQVYSDLCFVYDPIDSVEQPMKWAAHVGKECLPYAAFEWIPDFLNLGRKNAYIGELRGKTYYIFTSRYVSKTPLDTLLKLGNDVYEIQNVDLKRPSDGSTERIPMLFWKTYKGGLTRVEWFATFFEHCLHSKGTRFIAWYVSLRKSKECEGNAEEATPSSGHANVFLYDKETQTLELFEPHGWIDLKLEKSLPFRRDLFYAHVKKMIRRAPFAGRVKTLVLPNDMFVKHNASYSGWQTLDVPQEAPGACQFYTALYLFARLRHPELSAKRIVARLVKNRPLLHSLMLSLTSLKVKMDTSDRGQKLFSGYVKRWLNRIRSTPSGKIAHALLTDEFVAVQDDFDELPRRIDYNRYVRI
jgi:hypothetical protein